MSETKSRLEGVLGGEEGEDLIILCVSPLDSVTDTTDDDPNKLRGKKKKKWGGGGERGEKSVSSRNLPSGIHTHTHIHMH